MKNGITKQLAPRMRILRLLTAVAPEVVYHQPGNVAVLANGVDFHPPSPPVGVAIVELDLSPEMLGRIVSIEGSDEAQRCTFVILVRVPEHMERVDAQDYVVAEVAWNIRWKWADFHVDREGVVWEASVSGSIHGARLVM